jgi:uncharacterized protein YdcH (DUF465 family)
MASAAEKLDAELRHLRAKVSGLDREVQGLERSRRSEDQLRVSQLKRQRVHYKDRTIALEKVIIQSLGGSLPKSAMA